MNRSSDFIKDKGRFGSYPTQEAVEELERNGVRCFVDLTLPNERGTRPYSTNYCKIKFPIVDRSVPTDLKAFTTFIFKVVSIINNLKRGEKIYIHCKGGHGRSGIVVSCILYFMSSTLSANGAMRETSACHSKRVEMREHWRRIGSPQTDEQKNFVRNMCKDKIISSNSSQYGIAGSEPKKIKTNLGVFPTITHAYLAYKKPSDSLYVSDLSNGRKTTIPESDNNWNHNKEKYMRRTLRYMFSQYNVFKDQLLNTGIRRIAVEGDNSYWHSKNVSVNKKGQDIMGRILSTLRMEFQQQNM